MLLSAKTLLNASSANDFSWAEVAQWSAGDPYTWTFQLRDLTKDLSTEGFSPPGRRYAPAAGSTLVVTLQNIDDAKKVTRAAAQPFSQDPSIWRLSVLPSDGARGTVDMLLTLTEGVNVTHGRVKGAACVATQGEF